MISKNTYLPTYLPTYTHVRTATASYVFLSDQENVLPKPNLYTGFSFLTKIKEFLYNLDFFFRVGKYTRSRYFLLKMFSSDWKKKKEKFLRAIFNFYPSRYPYT